MIAFPQHPSNEVLKDRILHLNYYPDNYGKSSNYKAKEIFKVLLSCETFTMKNVLDMYCPFKK